MSTWKRWIAAAGFALGVWIPTVAVPASAESDAPAVDPAALRILKQRPTFSMGCRRSRATTEHHRGVAVLGAPGRDPRLAASVVVKRPNKLRAARTGRFMKQSFYYDGKALTLYNPTENVYASQAAPETVEGMLNLARRRLGSCSRPPTWCTAGPIRS